MDYEFFWSPGGDNWHAELKAIKAQPNSIPPFELGDATAVCPIF
jgi:hypothetical protein